MGQVFVDIEVLNFIDHTLAAQGELPSSRVRSEHLREVLADTGASTLSLPRRVIDALGLPRVRAVTVRTAAGTFERGLYGGALVRFEDRVAQTEVVELPDDAEPLLGAVPMELMGLELDLQTRTVRKRPDQGRNSYWYT